MTTDSVPDSSPSTFDTRVEPFVTGRNERGERIVDVSKMADRIDQLQAQIHQFEARSVVRVTEFWIVLNKNGFAINEIALSRAYAKNIAVDWERRFPEDAPYRVCRVALVDESVAADRFHVGDYVQDEMDSRNWNRNQLADAMCGPSDDWRTTRLCLDLMLEVREPNMRLGEVAGQLARAFGTSAALWTRLDEAWRTHPATVAAAVTTATGGPSNARN